MKKFGFLRKTENKKNKRGVSIVEAVVAIAVISIISFVGADLVTRFATISERTTYRTEARYATENALECFRFSVDENQFEKSVVEVAGFTKSSDAETESSSVYVKNAKNYNIIVTVNYNGNVAEFSALATDGGGKEILKVEKYERVIAEVIL